MEDARFDALSRSIISGSRRGVLAALLGGTFGALGLAKTAAKKGKGKKRKRPANRPFVSPPPAPSCADGVKNGSESDVDCGGGCKRCTPGQTCGTRNDCATALCTGGACTACTASAECGSDGALACSCQQPSARSTAPAGPMVCVHIPATGDRVFNCDECPADTFCVSRGPGLGFDCHKLCGAA
jgi:hypothetical protein